MDNRKLAIYVLLALMIVILTIYVLGQFKISSLNKEVEKYKTELNTCTEENHRIVYSNNLKLDSIQKINAEKDILITELSNSAKKLLPKYEQIKKVKLSPSDSALLESLYRTIQHPISR